MRNLVAAAITVFCCIALRGTGANEPVPGALKTFCSIGKGSPALNGYREAALLKHLGKGCLSHMWFGGDWPGYHRTRIRVYVDDEKMASIDMELGLGHGYGFGDEDPIFFKKGLRLTCRCGETEDGTNDGKPAGSPPETEYTTYTWVSEW